MPRAQECRKGGPGHKAADYATQMASQYLYGVHTGENYVVRPAVVSGGQAVESFTEIVPTFGDLFL